MKIEYRYSPVWTFGGDVVPVGDEHQGGVQGDAGERHLAEVRGQVLGQSRIPPPDGQADGQGQEQEPQQRLEQVPGVTPACGTCSRVSIQGSTSGMNGTAIT
jgi:hypothetical protein